MWGLLRQGCRTRTELEPWASGHCRYVRSYTHTPYSYSKGVGRLFVSSCCIRDLNCLCYQSHEDGRAGDSYSRNVQGNELPYIWQSCPCTWPLNQSENCTVPTS